MLVLILAQAVREQVQGTVHARGVGLQVIMLWHCSLLRKRFQVTHGLWRVCVTTPLSREWLPYTGLAVPFPHVHEVTSPLLDAFRGIRTTLTLRGGLGLRERLGPAFMVKDVTRGSAESLGSCSMDVTSAWLGAWDAASLPNDNLRWKFFCIAVSRT